MVGTGAGLPRGGAQRRLGPATQVRRDRYVKGMVLGGGAGDLDAHLRRRRAALRTDGCSRRACHNASRNIGGRHARQKGGGRGRRQRCRVTGDGRYKWNKSGLPTRQRRALSRARQLTRGSSCLVRSQSLCTQRVSHKFTHVDGRQFVTTRQSRASIVRKTASMPARCRERREGGASVTP